MNKTIFKLSRNDDPFRNRKYSEPILEKYLPDANNTSVDKAFKISSKSHHPFTTSSPMLELTDKLLEEKDTGLLKAPIEIDHYEAKRKLREKYLKLRWVISFCDCIMQISKFFCMDSAQALQKYFMSGNLNLSGTQYNLFYSVFAYLFILPFIAGYLCDKLGLRRALFLFCTVQTIGHIIFMFAGDLEWYWLMLIGRFIFGLGALCVEVCEDVVISTWFFDKELTMALGLSFSSCRIGTALTSVITPKVMHYAEGKYILPLFVGTLFSIVGFIACIIIIVVDKKYKKYIRQEQLDEYLADVSLSHQEGKDKFKEVKSLSKIFWVVAFNSLFAYTAYFSFVDNGNDILCTIYKFSPTQAGDLLTIVYMVSAFLTPLFGIFIDKFGYRLYLMIFALSILIIPHCLFIYLPDESHKIWIIVSLFLIGVFFSLHGAIFWSCIPLIVEDSKQGIAFGIVYSSLNIVLVIASLVIGIIHDTTLNYMGGYQFGIVFMIISLILAIISTIILKILDKKKGGPLNSKKKNIEIRRILNKEKEEDVLYDMKEEVQMEFDKIS